MSRSRGTEEKLLSAVTPRVVIQRRCWRSDTLGPRLCVTHLSLVLRLY